MTEHIPNFAAARMEKHHLNHFNHTAIHKIMSRQPTLKIPVIPGATQHPNDELFKIHSAIAVQVDLAPVAFQTTLRHVRRI